MGSDYENFFAIRRSITITNVYTVGDKSTVAAYQEIQSHALLACCRFDTFLRAANGNSRSASRFPLPRQSPWCLSFTWFEVRGSATKIILKPRSSSWTSVQQDGK